MSKCFFFSTKEVPKYQDENRDEAKAAEEDNDEESKEQKGPDKDADATDGKPGESRYQESFSHS